MIYRRRYFISQKRSVLNQITVSGELGPTVGEVALTHRTVVAVVVVGRVAVELERAGSLAEVQIDGAVVVVVHRPAALKEPAALGVLAASRALAALEALAAFVALAASGPLAALAELVVLGVPAVLGPLAALEALVETKQGHLVGPR